MNKLTYLIIGLVLLTIMVNADTSSLTSSKELIKETEIYKISEVTTEKTLPDSKIKTKISYEIEIIALKETEKDKPKPVVTLQQVTSDIIKSKITTTTTSTTTTTKTDITKPISTTTTTLGLIRD